MRHHVRPELLEDVRYGATTDLHVVDFTGRLVALLHETATVRAYARQVSDGTMLLRAVQAERDTP